MSSSHNELIHLGEIFKRKRQEISLTLKEVENATSIRVHYLAAIEEGHLAKLISPVYAQGFIKKYASFLEIDGELLIRQHPSVMKMLSHGEEEKSDFTFGVGTLEARDSPEREVRWLPSLLWVGLSVLIIVSCWLLVRFFNLI